MKAGAGPPGGVCAVLPEASRGKTEQCFVV